MATNEWVRIQVGPACTKIGSGATPRGGGETYLAAGPYALIRSQNVYNDGFHREGLAFISEEQANDLSNVAVEANDVLLNITGDSVARCCQVDQSILPARVNQHVAIIRPDREKLDARFLRYALISPQMQERMLSWAGAGGTRSALTKAMIEAFELRAPGDVHQQQAIARVLGTLDDKIELNRRMSDTLEAIVRAMFTSWFVNFEPVRAKAEGRDPGLPQYVSDLFPSALEDSELGEIPAGWKVGALGEVAEHPRRGVQPHEIDPSTPYIALEHMPRRCIALSEWAIGDGLESNKFEFKRGEILFGKLRPYFHKVGVAPVDGVCSTDIVVVSPRKGEWFSFVLGHTSSEAFVEYTDAGSTGTKMPRTSWNEMARYSVAVPPERVAAAFTSLTKPAIDHIIAMIHESRTLSALRDTLLPKLISGELQLKHVERILEKTV